ncbi:MAG: hypothetical protein KC442_03585 [Thermomicrobiales bacterium]|nr:hypothetical protein [Thermomicrobiales bacterium]
MTVLRVGVVGASAPCRDAEGQAVSVGDVVQLDPFQHVRFGGCYLTVTEARNWGVQGWVAWPEAPATARACYRAERHTYLRVGVAAWQPATTDGEE